MYDRCIQLHLLFDSFRHISCFIVVLYLNCLNCLCANLAYGLPELNKLTYLLTYLLTNSVHVVIILYVTGRLNGSLDEVRVVRLADK